MLPLLAEWFVAEWPGWYGVGGQGNVFRDLEEFAASEGSLPVGFVAFLNGRPVGAGALKAESIPSHKHLIPWAAAGYVVPSFRGRGIGAELLKSMLVRARSLGYAHVFCATSTAESLLLRSGWTAIEVTQHAGKSLTVFRSAV